MRTSKAVVLFIQSRQARGLSKRTLKWYTEILNRFADHYKTVTEKPEQIEKFIISLNVGDERRHGYYRTLKAFYNFLKRRDYINNNPIQYIDEPKLSVKNPSILTPETINKILHHQSKKEIKSAIMTLIDTGARLAEIANLEINNLIETPDGFLAVVNGKTGMRAIPISYETYHALMVTLPFKWSKDHLGRLISRHCRDAGIKASSLTFRHSFATLWNGDELILQQIMGHTTLNTTKRYRHLRTQNAIRQHNQYSPLKMVLSFSKSML